MHSIVEAAKALYTTKNMWKSLLFSLYTLGIHAGNLFLFIGHYFSEKINLLYQGRQNTIKKCKNPSNLSEVVWIHCASLGEFEQGRPLIEEIKKDYPATKILLSFFSPSGYEIRKTYPFADEVIYLPSDLPCNAERLIHHYQPKSLILVKYEFWWNLIRATQSHHIPIYAISAIFRPKDYFFKPILYPFKMLLSGFECLFIQDQQSAQVLNHHKISNYQMVGDTRIDRVISLSQISDVPKKIIDFIQDRTTVIYGSIWNEDISVINTMVTTFPDFCHIIAPHDISSGHIETLRKNILFTSSLYSDEYPDKQLLIINNIGILASLYKVADYVYIGGGFGAGIHNILEPAVHGIPVFFGPQHKKFNEAVELVQSDSAFAITKPEEMTNQIQQWQQQPDVLNTIAAQLQNYFGSNQGATQKIIRHLGTILEKT
ncbi:MAG: hypothetical protein J5I52_02625 [Saprospiraceae bacterium]|nr:hypothetical protein [Saprospiraceae bacterium]